LQFPPTTLLKKNGGWETLSPIIVFDARNGNLRGDYISIEGSNSSIRIIFIETDRNKGVSLPETMKVMYLEGILPFLEGIKMENPTLLRMEGIKHSKFVSITMFFKQNISRFCKNSNDLRAFVTLKLVPINFIVLYVNSYKTHEGTGNFDVAFTERVADVIWDSKECARQLQGQTLKEIKSSMLDNLVKEFNEAMPKGLARTKKALALEEQKQVNQNDQETEMNEGPALLEEAAESKEKEIT
jgi:hypothetical protein